MSAEAVRYIQAQKIRPLSLKYYMEKVAYRVNNKRGYGWPSQEFLAAELQVSERTIRNYQRECIKRGYLRVTQARKRHAEFTSNHYVIAGFMEWLPKFKQKLVDCAVEFFNKAAELFRSALPTVERKGSCLQKERLNTEAAMKKDLHTKGNIYTPHVHACAREELPDQIDTTAPPEPSHSVQRVIYPQPHQEQDDDDATFDPIAWQAAEWERIRGVHVTGRSEEPATTDRGSLSSGETQDSCPGSVQLRQDYPFGGHWAGSLSEGAPGHFHGPIDQFGGADGPEVLPSGDLPQRNHPSGPSRSGFDGPHADCVHPVA